ncbi:MAG: septum formation protein Maf [Ruminococcaceae bacterium]|nr:septum formation protein Maf [Oscillospiraceae bacterium]
MDKDTNTDSIILASASPRRKEILSSLGVQFSILVADTDESCDIREPFAFAEELARRKGQAAYALTDKKDSVILSADTIVVCDGEILGKPKSRDDAIRMIKKLSGKTHSVITGVGVTVNGITTTNHSETFVRVDDIPQIEIERYVDSGDPMDKAGAYGIQGAFSRWISGIDGCYFGVVGLPTNCLANLFYEVTGKELTQFNV